MAKRGLFFGAAILLICNFISRSLGFIYKIILVRLIGTAGIGITEMTSPVYTFALVGASLGIPLALSRLLAREIGARRYQNLRLMQRTAILMLAALGAITALICYQFAPALLTRFATGEGAEYLRILSPAVFLVTVCSGFRAYFQATKQIGIIGISQNLEQTVRVVTGSIMVWLALPYGVERQIEAVAAATVLGELCGLLFIMHAYLRQRPRALIKPTTTAVGIGVRLLSFGAPVTVQRLISSAILMLQAMLIPLALQQGGLSAAEATNAYGNFSGVALSLVHLPGIFTATLAMALLPSIAECEHNRVRLNSRVNQSLQITAVIALPFALLFGEFASELTDWLFNAPAAAQSLRVLAIAAPFIYAQTALTSILQGMGKLNALFISLTLSGALFIGTICLLTPRLGLEGAATAELVFAATATIIDIAFLHHYSGFRTDCRNIITKPLLAAAVATISAKTAEILLPAAFSQYANFLLLCSVGGLAYLIVLLALNGLPRVMRHYLNPALYINRLFRR